MAMTTLKSLNDDWNKWYSQWKAEHEKLEAEVKQKNVLIEEKDARIARLRRDCHEAITGSYKARR
jgi:hypothetical protein